MEWLYLEAVPNPLGFGTASNLAANPASKVINVVLPVNVPVKIFAWTRE